LKKAVSGLSISALMATTGKPEQILFYRNWNFIIIASNPCRLSNAILTNGDYFNGLNIPSAVTLPAAHPAAISAAVLA
jgi:hypothetical protein